MNKDFYLIIVIAVTLLFSFIYCINDSSLFDFMYFLSLVLFAYRYKLAK